MSPTTGGDRSNCERALDLTERGWSQRRIAKHLGIGKTTVHDYVVGEYGNGAEILAKREHLRAIELARVDRVIRRLDRILMARDAEVAVKAGAALLKASERRAKLLGLDAPTKTQAVEPDDIAKMSPEQKLAAHEKAAEELRREIAEGKDGMH